MKNKRILKLIIMLVFTMNMVLAQENQETSLKEEYKASITKAIQKDMDRVLNKEVARRGGEYPGWVMLESYSLDGPVTQLDVYNIKESFEKLNPPRNNFKNHLGLVRRNLDVLDMAYTMSGDTWFLDKMVEICDNMIDAQNGPGKYKSITGNYEYYWPTNFVVKDGKIYTNTALFTNGVIAGRVMNVAQRLLENKELLDNKAKTKDEFKFGQTYRERAMLYVDRTSKTLDYLVKYSYGEETGLMVCPEEFKYSNRPDFVGMAPAWNRDFMMGMDFMNGYTILSMLNKDNDKVKFYQKINQKC